MRKFCISAALLGAASGFSASAADFGGGMKDTPVIVEPPFVWQGMYLGAQIGGTWSSARVTDHYDYRGDPTAIERMADTGFTGGGRAGFLLQWGRFVAGLEGDVGYLSLSGSKSAYLPGVITEPASYYDGTTKKYLALDPTCYYCDLNVRYGADGGVYGDLVFRAGYTFDRLMVYGKAGVAIVNTEFNADYLGNNYLKPQNGGSPFHFAQQATLSGWTAGLGVEYALTSGWSVGADYQHFDFGDLTYSYLGNTTFPCDPYICTSHLEGRASASVTADVAKVGLNYRLSSGLGF